MRMGSIAVIIVTAIMLGVSPRVSAQTVGHVFRAVNVSVVVIKAKGRDVATEGGSLGEAVGLRGGSKVAVRP